MFIAFSNMLLGVICLEEFAEGTLLWHSMICSQLVATGAAVARLSCLCSFHNGMVTSSVCVTGKLMNLIDSLPRVLAAARQELSCSRALGNAGFLYIWICIPSGPSMIYMHTILSSAI